MESYDDLWHKCHNGDIRKYSTFACSSHAGTFHDYTGCFDPIEYIKMLEEKVNYLEGYLEYFSEANNNHMLADILKRSKEMGSIVEPAPMYPPKKQIMQHEMFDTLTKICRLFERSPIGSIPTSHLNKLPDELNRLWHNYQILLKYMKKMKDIIDENEGDIKSDDIYDYLDINYGELSNEMEKTSQQDK